MKCRADYYAIFQNQQEMMLECTGKAFPKNETIIAYYSSFLQKEKAGAGSAWGYLLCIKYENPVLQISITISIFVN